MAGLLVADTEYRHQIAVAGLAMALVVMKALIIFALADLVAQRLRRSSASFSLRAANSPSRS